MLVFNEFGTMGDKLGEQCKYLLQELKEMTYLWLLYLFYSGYCLAKCDVLRVGLRESMTGCGCFLYEGWLLFFLENILPPVGFGAVIKYQLVHVGILSVENLTAPLCDSIVVIWILIFR